MEKKKIFFFKLYHNIKLLIVFLNESFQMMYHSFMEEPQELFYRTEAKLIDRVSFKKEINLFENNENEDNSELCKENKKGEVSISIINDLEVKSISNQFDEFNQIIEYRANSFVLPDKFLKFHLKLKKKLSEEEYSQYLNKYYQITKILESHLTSEKNKCHPLNFLRKSYLTNFITHYKLVNQIEDYYDKKEEKYKTEDTIEMMLDDLKDFLTIFSKSTILYYNHFEQFSDEIQILLNTQNIKNLVTNLFFSNSELSKLILNSQKKIDNNKEVQFRKNRKKLLKTKTSIEDYGINKKFLHLNDQKPFSKAIDCLKNIQNLNSPVHKLKSILSLGEYVKEYIYENSSFEELDEIKSDDLMMIFVYIIINSGMNCIISEIHLIERFVHSKTLETMYHDYSFCTFRACVDYIQEMKIK